MKATFVAFALLYSSQVSAVQLRDIFDAYDRESEKEAKNHSDTVDAVQLQAEIGGEEIAREVKGATAGVAEGTLLQINDQMRFVPEEAQETVDIQVDRRITDEDGDGVEDNVHKTQDELDRFRKMVFGAETEDMHNTRNGELPGHHRADDHPVPGEGSNLPSFVQAETDVRAMNEYDGEYLQLNEHQESFADMVSQIQGPEDLSELIMLQSAWKRGANRITDADGDGVEDNIKKTRDELDRFYEPLVFKYAEEINNTHHGNLPGHVQQEFTLSQPAPASMDLIKADWKRL